ncbi:reverse transcriptase domain-containing protein [Tanacetum coccineum]
MPPRRSSATARAAVATAARAIAATAATAVTATPMTADVVEQLIEARVSAALANHETLRNSTNSHGDESHDSETGIRGTVRTPRECMYKDFLNCKPLTFKGTEGVVVLSQWFEKMESVFHIRICVTVTQYVAYAMDWKALKKMMTVKYYPRGEIKKLEIELWNLKVKGTDVASYTLRFQELALMCGRMFHEESEEVEKYVGGLPDMIRGNKRKLEFNAGNNQGHQQQNKRQNTGRAYTAGPGEKREYTGSLPLCTKCNYHHKGPCAPRCNKCKKIGHLARDCRSSGPNGNNNNRGNSGTTQNAGTCYECGVQGHFKRDCPKLKNKNRGNQGGNGNAPAKVYVVGNAGTNPDSNVVTGACTENLYVVVLKHVSQVNEDEVLKMQWDTLWGVIITFGQLDAYTDSYTICRATQDRKSTIGGCQFLGNRLISSQCKKQTVVATSITKAEYVAAANLLTKGFDAGRFQYLVSSIGMLNP